MRNEQLLEAIGSIREEWIDDARMNVRRKHRFPIIAAAILLCMTLTVSALAAVDVEGVYELLYAVSPAIAQRLKPVQMSCVDDGIELTVISADVEGDTARVLVGLRDLKGNRVDGTCDLYNSYQINLPSDTISGCTFAEFDETTKTAVFLVEISRADGKNIRGDKLTFSLREFLSGASEHYDYIDLDLTKVQLKPETRSDFVSLGGSAQEGYNYESIASVLKADGALLKPIEHVTVTGMGYVDGLLHIQIHYENSRANDGHGYISLKDADGNEIFPVCEVSFGDEARTGSYDELLFDISPEELAGCRPFGYFRSADSIHSGDWEITFPLE